MSMDVLLCICFGVNTQRTEWMLNLFIYYVGVYTQRSVNWSEGNQDKTKNSYMFHNRN